MTEFRSDVVSIEHRDRIAIVQEGRILADDTLEGLRADSGQHYLEDIFVHYVRRPS